MKNIEKVLESKSYINSQLFISEKYHDLIDIFKKQNADKLFSHWKEYDIRIELKTEKTFNFSFLYSMLQDELQILQQYLNKHLAKSFIWLNCSSFAFLMLFVKKSDEEFWFCVNYQVLNAIIIWNQYLIFLI